MSTVFKDIAITLSRIKMTRKGSLFVFTFPDAERRARNIYAGYIAYRIKWRKSKQGRKLENA
jgi:hypothetical protein